VAVELMEKSLTRKTFSPGNTSAARVSGHASEEIGHEEAREGAKNPIHPFGIF
jgi:hypothetical protein